MSYDNLTRTQQDLLRWMVKISETKFEPTDFLGMRDEIRYSSQIILYSPDGDEFPTPLNMSLLDSMEAEKLVKIVRNDGQQSSITILCSLRQLAFEAVKKDFKKTPQKIDNKMQSGIIIEKFINSGSGQTFIGEFKNNKISQIVNDPKLLETHVLELTNKIRSEISELKFEERIQYEEYLRDLAKQLLSEKPEPSKIKKLIGSIGFLGDIGGTIDLIEKVWPLLLQLFVLSQSLHL